MVKARKFRNQFANSLISTALVVSNPKVLQGDSDSISVSGRQFSRPIDHWDQGQAS